MANLIPFAVSLVGGTVVNGAWNYASENFLKGRATSNNTGNWTQLAKQGKLRRAHGRDEILENLRIAITNHSFVILVGPSGTGKTALVEELTCKFLEEKEGSKMYGVEVLSLGQRKMDGDPGLKGAMTNILDGGVEKRIQTIMEYLQKLTNDGTIRILFIDEFQDLLLDCVAPFTPLPIK
ncbi:MAG TPA: AAA family ATPase [Rhabdochlamydiaceae bacterium]|jgi:ATP-dependent Clp protease ATP-binding subunit ClpA|nr:AAA family ATPase [Rhabdochlamydiaceae bacterium]